MGNLNRYVTGMILAATIFAFGGFYFLKGAVRTMSQSEFDMSYNMPRPKSALYNFFFGLEGREIERTEINSFKDKKAEDKKLPTAANAPKIDAKAQAAAQKLAQQNAAAKANAAAAKRSELKVNVVNAAPTSPLQSSELNQNQQMYGNGGSVGSALPAATNSQAAEAKKETLSGSQWRALVLAQPTKENVSKLLAAFNNKEVDSTTVFQIMNELMLNSNPETQSQGLFIGQSVPSLKSFSIVSTSYDKLDSENKKTAQNVLMSYMQGSRLSILALALQSEDNQVVTRAAQVMVAGLEQAKNGQTDGSIRANAGRGVVASGTSAYSQFVSIFENLVKTGDSTVAGLAQNALTQIQSLSNT